jgi:hypothetical protein
MVSPMPLLLAFQPDPIQASALRDALRDQIRGEVVVVESIDTALATIDCRIPDVILLPALMPPAEEDYLMAYISTVPGADHVQTIGIPRFERRDVENLPTRSFFRWQRPQPHDARAVGCDSGVFARDVVDYLTRAKALKEEIELRRGAASGRAPERRGERRWSPREVPWVSHVRLADGEQADLINISSGGALLRTSSRPERRYLKRSHPGCRQFPLTFKLKSGDEVRATARIVRCHAGSMGSAPLQYEIAFSFDDSFGLDLPAAGSLVSGTGASSVDVGLIVREGQDLAAGLAGSASRNRNLGVRVTRENRW